MSRITMALPGVAAVAALALAASAQAAPMQVTVTIENLASANGLSFAPLSLGFHSGSYDAFDIGQVATAPIISVAEFGAGEAYRAAFAAADPTASIGIIPPVPLLPGAMSSATFLVDTMANPYFSFAAMVLPSNDFFIGNDSATAYPLFDAAGSLQIASITQRARDVWDAGSEIFDPATAAFVGDINGHEDQNSVVALNFAELAAFNGLVTGAGYTLDSHLTGDTEMYRISFVTAPVPEPETYSLMMAGLLGVGWLARRRRQA